ncbi:Cytokinin hydroxylase [Leucoagaricus sp. SymC.cos]|nr:Cytokinin hydroxylase [Leucoagaricus sp. SymC.cos]
MIVTSINDTFSVVSRLICVFAIVALFRALFWLLNLFVPLPLSDPLKELPGPDGKYVQTHFNEVMNPSFSPGTHETWVQKYGRTFKFNGFGGVCSSAIITRAVIEPLFQYDLRLLSLDFRVISHVLTSPNYEKPWQTRSLLGRLIGRARKDNKIIDENFRVINQTGRTLIANKKNDILNGHKEKGTKDLLGFLKEMWDPLNSLPFLGTVVRETLRFCPPVHETIRVAMEDDKIPISYPLKLRDGTLLNKGDYITIRQGSYIHIPIESLNYSEEFWGPDARTFDPDRWFDFPAIVRSLAYPGLGNFMTFSFGPRSCLGYKFTVAEMKIFICTLTMNFIFTPTPDTEVLKYNPILTKPFIKNKWEMGAQLPLDLALTHVEFRFYNMTMYITYSFAKTFLLRSQKDTSEIKRAKRYVHQPLSRLVI